MPPKSSLRKTIRPVEETAGFVIFSKCRVVFSKCCLRVPSGPCRMTEKYEKTPEQARDNRQSAPVQCKDNTFFAEIQIAKFRVNISWKGSPRSTHGARVVPTRASLVRLFLPCRRTILVSRVGATRAPCFHRHVVWPKPQLPPSSPRRSMPWSAGCWACPSVSSLIPTARHAWSAGCPNPRLICAAFFACPPCCRANIFLHK